MSVCYYKIKGSSKRFVDVMKSIAEFKNYVFAPSVKVLSPKSREWVITCPHSRRSPSEKRCS